MAVCSRSGAPTKDLLDEIKHLEELFAIDTAKLKEITHHFADELTKGGWHQQPTNGSDRQALTRHRSQRSRGQHCK